MLSLFVIDHFYSDPDSVRNRALQMRFDSKALNLPALRSDSTYLAPEVTALFRSALNIDLQEASVRIPLNGCFQLMRKQDRTHSYIHSDRSAQWAAIVYLTPQSTSRAGTYFYRHKLTGLTRYPASEEFQQVAHSFDLTSEELKALLLIDQKKKSRWIETDVIEFEYNRLALYDAKRFHRNGETWGTTPQSARLTHNFFV